MAGKDTRSNETEPSRSDIAVGEPRDLHPTSDIRFVMRETAGLKTQVERLIGDVKEHGEKLNGVVDKLKDALHKTDVAVGKIETQMSHAAVKDDLSNAKVAFVKEVADFKTEVVREIGKAQTRVIWLIIGLAAAAAVKSFWPWISSHFS